MGANLQDCVRYRVGEIRELQGDGGKIGSAHNVLRTDPQVFSPMNALHGIEPAFVRGKDPRQVPEFRREVFRLDRVQQPFAFSKPWEESGFPDQNVCQVLGVPEQAQQQVERRRIIRQVCEERGGAERRLNEPEEMGEHPVRIRGLAQSRLHARHEPGKGFRSGRQGKCFGEDAKVSRSKGRVAEWYLT